MPPKAQLRKEVAEYAFERTGGCWAVVTSGRIIEYRPQDWVSNPFCLDTLLRLLKSTDSHPQECLLHTLLLVFLDTRSKDSKVLLATQSVCSSQPVVWIPLGTWQSCRLNHPLPCHLVTQNLHLEQDPGGISFVHSHVRSAWVNTPCLCLPSSWLRCIVVAAQSPVWLGLCAGADVLRDRHSSSQAERGKKKTSGTYD